MYIQTDIEIISDAKVFRNMSRLISEQSRTEFIWTFFTFYEQSQENEKGQQSENVDFRFIVIQLKYGVILKMSLPPDFSIFLVADFAIYSVSNVELSLTTDRGF